MSEIAADPPGGSAALDVLALVLTYNAPENASACIAGLNEQVSLPASILIVENAGVRRVDPRALAASSGVVVGVLALEENSGPAGGYAAGLRRAQASACDLIWVLDDDVAPDPQCLARQIDVLREHGDRAVVLPESIDVETGEHSSTWGWCGALFPRRLIDEIGVPIPELFYGFEDHEYLIDRAAAAGYPLVRATSALVRLGRRPGLSRPAWHYYYLARNSTFVYLYRKSGVRLDHRMKRWVRYQYGLARTILRYHQQGRVRRGVYLARGVTDGVLRRLGRRLEPSDDRRPSVAR